MDESPGTRPTDEAEQSVRLSWWETFALTVIGSIFVLAIMVAILHFGFPLTYEPGAGSSSVDP